jgi:hypothetical protein
MELTWLAANNHELLLQESPEKIIRPDSQEPNAQPVQNGDWKMSITARDG